MEGESSFCVGKCFPGQNVENKIEGGVIEMGEGIRACLCEERSSDMGRCTLLHEPSLDPTARFADTEAGEPTPYRGSP